MPSIKKPSLGPSCHHAVCRAAFAISQVAPGSRGDMPDRFIELMVSLAIQRPNAASCAALEKMGYLEQEANRAASINPKYRRTS